MSYSGIECVEEADAQKENIKRLKLLTDEYKERNGRALKACIVTFGCQMNFRDSEKLCGILKSAGFEITEDENCDLVILIDHICRNVTVSEFAENAIIINHIHVLLISYQCTYVSCLIILSHLLEYSNTYPPLIDYSRVLCYNRYMGLRFQRKNYTRERSLF